MALEHAEKARLPREVILHQPRSKAITVKFLFSPQVLSVARANELLVVWDSALAKSTLRNTLRLTLRATQHVGVLLRRNEELTT
eukprot:2643246-Pleurochrysis_carterae.AAC.1